MMDSLWGSLLLELSVLCLLGMLYYYYQKRKILQFEDKKVPIIMGQILQSCLSERGPNPAPELDALIESIDDYLLHNTETPPTSLLKVFAASGSCSSELKAVIEEGLKELE